MAVELADGRRDTQLCVANEVEVADDLDELLVRIADVRPDTSSPSYAVSTLARSVCCDTGTGADVIDLADCQDWISDQFGV